MMACHNCRLLFDNGQICPNCGRTLVPYAMPAQNQPPVISNMVPTPQSTRPKHTGLKVLFIVLGAVLAIFLVMVVLVASQPSLSTETTPTYDSALSASSVSSASRTSASVQSAADAGWNHLHDLFTVFVAMRQYEDSSPEWEIEYEKLRRLYSSGDSDAAAAALGKIEDEYPDLTTAWVAAIASQPTVPYLCKGSDIAPLSTYMQAVTHYEITAKNYGVDTSTWELVD